MIRKGQLAVMGLAMLVTTATQVHAGIVNVTVTDTVTGFNDATNLSPPYPFTITFSGLPTDSVGGGVLSLTTFGDFSYFLEYIDISVDGDSQGRLWDNDPGNDSFTGTVLDNDVGRDYAITSSGSNPGANLFLSEAELDSFLADGTFVIGFDEFGPEVDDLYDSPNEYITATLTYQTASSAAVPEPTSLALFGISACVAGVGAARRRRGEKKAETAA